jgi:hypothetical protein
MKYRRLVACMAALAMGGGLGMSATPAVSAAPVQAGDWSQPRLPPQYGNGDEDWIYDETAQDVHAAYILDGPDVNGEQAYFGTGQDDNTWFELEQTTTTWSGLDTFWLCSNGSSHHCLQDEDGPVDVEDKAATSGQYWYFLGTLICNYYWTVHSDNNSACMYDSGGSVASATDAGDNFELTET